MTIREIQKILDAKVCCGEELLDREVHTACGSDLMSDVLAFVKDQAVLLTGLCNPQAIRPELCTEQTDVYGSETEDDDFEEDIHDPCLRFQR